MTSMYYGCMGCYIYFLAILPLRILSLASVFWMIGLMRDLQCVEASEVSCKLVDPWEAKAFHPMWYIKCSVNAYKQLLCRHEKKGDSVSSLLSSFVNDSIHNIMNEWQWLEMRWMKLTVTRGKYTFNDKNSSSSTTCAVLITKIKMLGLRLDLKSPIYWTELWLWRPKIRYLWTRIWPFWR